LDPAEEKIHAEERAQVRRFFAERTEGFFLEVGARLPFLGSQTWHLERRGWRGILVEPIPEQAEALRRERPGSQVFEAACSSPDKRGTADFHIADLPGWSSLERYAHPEPETRRVYRQTIQVAVRTVDEILAECGDPHVDFVSVDTEGTEVDVLRGFDLERHRPDLVLVEDYRYGLATHRHLTGRGYRLAHRTDPNSWYMPKDSPRMRPSLAYRLQLFRWMYLSLPFRKLRRWRKLRRERAANQ